MFQRNHQVSQLTLADLPNAVPWARRYVVDTLQRWRVPSEVTQTARLIVSELATAAVRGEEGTSRSATPYSQTASIGTFTILLHRLGPRLFIQVSDSDPTPLFDAPANQAEPQEARRLRGNVFLVDAMSHQWGHYHPRSRPGKVTWAEIRIDAAPKLRTSDQVAQEHETPDALLIGRVLVGLREAL